MIKFARLWDYCLLIAPNALAIFGVVFFKWSALAMLWLYWWENLAIGASVIFLLLLERERAWSSRVGQFGFFCVHFGIFSLVHAKVMTAIAGAVAPIFWGVMVQLFLWHFLASLSAAWRQGFAHRHIQQNVKRLYLRVAFLHIALLLGAFWVARNQSSVAVLWVLMAVKIAHDVYQYRQQRAA